MKKNIIIAYRYDAICLDCNKTIPIYLLLPDFGDPPIIKKCKACDTLYYYTPEDEQYIERIEKYLFGKKCVKCDADLLEFLVPTHTHIKCCNTVFSLDDDFFKSIGYDSIQEKIEVFLLYGQGDGRLRNN